MSAIGNFAQSFVKDTFKTALGIISSNIRSGTAGELARSNGIKATNIGEITVRLGATKNNSFALTNQFGVTPDYNTQTTNPSDIVVSAKKFSKSTAFTVPNSVISVDDGTLDRIDLTFGGGNK